MLQFVFGLPGSGKTAWIMDRLSEIAPEGRESVLLVPEQFSFETERRVLRTLGDKNARRVTVMSFTRLCDEVGRIAGGIAGVTLSGSDKVIFMSRALLAVSDQLLLWGKYCRSVTFAKTMLDTVGEFKINAISAGEIAEASEQTTGNALKNKLHDLALIYQTYDALVGEKFLDPADRLTKLYTQLESCRYFEGKEVFFDSFKSFTGQQYKIIKRILTQADNVTVSLTNDVTKTREFDLFSNIRKTVEKIRTIADNRQESQPVVLPAPDGAKPSLRAVERLLAGERQEAENTDRSDIHLVRAKTVYDEAEFALRTIRKLVREEGYRYRDFVLIARDDAQYSEAIEFFSLQNGVPCFSDKRLPLASFPLPVAALFAVKTAVSPTTDSILRYLKTGLGPLSTEEISRLENYISLWNIDGELWKKEWTMDPRGFVASSDPPDPETLSELNALRLKATGPLFRFCDRFGGTAEQMARALVELLEATDVADALTKLAEEYEEDHTFVGFDELSQSYTVFMKLLDSIVRCYGNITLSPREFYEALTLSVENETVGVIPRMLDEVTFGSADRIRPSRPKVAFLLGANRGIFPKTPSQGGIFGVKDRNALHAIGLELPDHILDDAVDENFLVYSAAACPSEKLYISFAATGAKGEALEPSDFVLQIRDALLIDFTEEPAAVLTEGSLPETADAVYSEFCKRYAAGDAAELKMALKQENAYSDKVAYLTDVLAGRKDRLSRDTAAQLYGTFLSLPPSRIERFNSCPYSYFCKFGLGTKRAESADFTSKQRGTLVHYVLEKLVSEHGNDLPALDEDAIKELVEHYAAAYLASVAGYSEIEDNRLRFLVGRITRMISEVACHLSLEFGQSDFVPQACELRIGKDGDIPPVVFPIEGGKVAMSGVIDRVDGYDGYLRVIDYKTGTKTFKLPDALMGLNLQMLLYLYAVTRGNGLDDEKAAGILYLRARRDPEHTGLAMSGLLQNDTELIGAMDKNMQGEFVPKYPLTKAGRLDSRCTSFIEKESFKDIFDYMELLMKRSGKRILDGDIAVRPLDGLDTPACKYCDYHAVCGIEDREMSKVHNMKNEEVIDRMREETEHGV